MNLFVKKIRRQLGLIRRIIYGISFKIFKIFPIKENRIIADNFHGNGFGDNPGAIINKLIEKKKEYDIYWVLNKSNYNSILPDGVKKVKLKSFKHYFILATSKIWIDNVRKNVELKRRKDQFYIQTWHGGLGFKKIEKDLEGKLPKSYLELAKIDSKNINLFLSNSTWSTNYFKKCFYYDGEFAETGFPRNDNLFDSNNFKVIKKKVYQDLNIDNDYKLLLYAPTFRDDGDISCYNIDYERVLNVLKEKTGSKWKILLRLHPNISNLQILNCQNDIINVSNYSKLNELMIACDYLITDYSSVAFEFAYLSRPIVLYVSDLSKYNDERGLLFDLNELPFPYATNNDELEKCINDYELKKYVDRYKIFFKKVGLIDDGKASERVAQIIINKINN